MEAGKNHERQKWGKGMDNGNDGDIASLIMYGRGSNNDHDYNIYVKGDALSSAVSKVHGGDINDFISKRFDVAPASPQQLKVQRAVYTSSVLAYK